MEGINRMKKIISAILLLALLCCGALAEGGVWTGAVLAGNLPKDAELIGIDSNAGGYIEELLYDKSCTIILARFADETARAEYLNAYAPVGEVQVLEDSPTVANCPAMHLRYESGDEADLNVIDCFAFGTEVDCFLFLISVDKKTYEGSGKVDENFYPELIAVWAESLTVFKP